MVCCLQASAAMRGDVNGDNAVDVSDLNLIINKILGMGNYSNTDLNGDNTTDVSDINIVINIILGMDVPETHEYVDLGLPGGVLWATCNIGAESPEDYGLYFAWGEIRGYAKDESHAFNWADYKWMTPGRSAWNYVTKYTTADGYFNCCWYKDYIYVGTIVDGVTYKHLIKLLPEDDAATANWGSGWRMPTRQETMDLFDYQYTRHNWVTVNGVPGRMITSKSNGNSIFLPAAGIRQYSRFDDEGTCGRYWTSDLLTASCSSARRLYFILNLIDWADDERCCGLPVRAVRVNP